MSNGASLPPRVRVKHGAYHYDLGRDENGRRRWKKLCRLSDGLHALYRALAELHQPRTETLGEAFDSYLASDAYAKLAPRTQADYLAVIESLRPAFQEAHPDGVTPGQIAQFLALRERQGAGVYANKQVAVLSTVYNYMQREGLYEGANPCKGVRRNRATPRTRYVTDEELVAAFESVGPEFQDFMAGLYLTGLRQIDLRRARKTWIAQRGDQRFLRLQETKRGKLLEIAITPALDEVIERASARSPQSPFIWTNSRGEPWSQWAIQSQVRRLRAKLGHDWKLHDIRAKAESDSETGLGLLALYKRAKRISALGRHLGRLVDTDRS